MPGTDLFKKWAIGFSGCDGGGLREGGVWFCGIEWGRSWKEDELCCELEKDVRKPEPYNESYLGAQLFGGKQPDGRYVDGRSCGFNRIMAKLYTVISGRPCNEYGDHFLRGGIQPLPFTDRSDMLKINLFPMACYKTSEWYDHYKRLTGFDSKKDYYQWCRENRFPFFQELAGRYRPRMIICCETRRSEDFLKAFGEAASGEASRILFPHEFEGRSGSAEIHKLNNGTNIIVTPFFGGRHSPLNRDANITKLGQWIASAVGAPQRQEVA